jgi:4-hydroxyphenylpyruvate dioxygenase-like putative hemolysin
MSLSILSIFYDTMGDFTVYLSFLHPIMTFSPSVDLRMPCSDNSIDSLKSSKLVVDREGPADRSVAHPNRLSNQIIVPSAS